MARIFLAHASEDKPAVRQVYALLEERGHEPWLDEKSLVGGQNWRTEIPRAIRNCDGVIAFFSNNAVHKSGYIQRELRLALSVAAERPPDKIFVIPVRLDACQLPNLELPDVGLSLADLHCIDLRKSDGRAKLLEAVERTAALRDAPSFQSLREVNDSAGKPRNLHTLAGQYAQLSEADERLHDALSELVGRGCLTINDQNGEPRIQLEYHFGYCVLGTADGSYRCDIPTHMFLTLYEFFYDNIDTDPKAHVQRKYSAAPPIVTQESVRYPNLLRLYCRNEHRLTLIECPDGDGWDLATPSGKVVQCEISEDIARQFFSSSSPSKIDDA